MTIAYSLGSALYLNLTNRCPCDCVFCLRNTGEGVNPGESLWLDHDPSAEEVMTALEAVDFEQYSEVVFCGYGEPTERLDVLLECAAYLKKTQKLPIRLNTNGLSDLINKKKTAPLLAEYMDIISISLNAPDEESYISMCAPVFGKGSFDALLQFAKDCKKFPAVKVNLSVVAHTINKDTLARCQALCDSLDIPLRRR